MTTPTLPVRLHISSHVAPVKNVLSSFGKPHYSYALASQAHLSALEQVASEIEFLPDPERQSAAEWGPYFSGPESANVHISFRNFRSLRPVGWAHNIAVVVWEFDKLYGYEAAEGRVFRNQLQMLRGFDQIWVATNHFKDLLAKYGLSNVSTVPAPVFFAPLTADEAAGAKTSLLNQPSITFAGIGAQKTTPTQCALAYQKSLIERKGPVFLAIFNPLDPRKDLEGLIAAFIDFKRTNRDGTLILKFSVDPDKFTIENFQDALLEKRNLIDAPLPGCDDIIFLASVLEKSELQALYGLADFFVSPTRGEGQNLPLIEAMTCGLPTIAPRHTAMLDYHTDEIGIPIEFQKRQTPLGLRPHYHLVGREAWYELPRTEIKRALVSASRLSRRKIDAMSQSAEARAQELYSIEAVATKMQSSLRRIRNTGVRD